MSTTKREPLLSDASHLDAPCQYNNEESFAWASGHDHARDIYEAARAKDAELIQQLVDALHWYVEEDDVREGDFSAEGGTNWDEENAPWIEGRNEAISILDAAAAAGFKPTE